MSKPTRTTSVTQFNLETLKKRFYVDDKGTLRRNKGNTDKSTKDGNSVALYRIGGKLAVETSSLKDPIWTVFLSATRLAYVIQYDELPNPRTSIIHLNGDEKDFRKKNLEMVDRYTRTNRNGKRRVNST